MNSIAGLIAFQEEQQPAFIHITLEKPGRVRGPRPPDPAPAAQSPRPRSGGLRPGRFKFAGMQAPSSSDAPARPPFRELAGCPIFFFFLPGSLYHDPQLCSSGHLIQLASWGCSPDHRLPRGCCQHPRTAVPPPRTRSPPQTPREGLRAPRSPPQPASGLETVDGDRHEDSH